MNYPLFYFRVKKEREKSGEQDGEGSQCDDQNLGNYEFKI